MYRTAVLWALALAASLQAGGQQPRAFSGLRAELNAADAVLRIRVMAVQRLDPTPPMMEGRPERLQLDVAVVKVLAGSGLAAGDRVGVIFPAREYSDWARDLSGYEILAGVHTGSDMTALMSRRGNDWTVRTLFRAYDAERTDAFFAEYARVARLDDRAFAIGLARHLADRVAGRPGRLLWARWALLAFDDWDRLRMAGQVRSAQLRRSSQDALHAVLKQIDATVRGKGEGVSFLSCRG